MSIADGKMRLQNAHGDYIEIDRPIFGYKTTVVMPFTLQESDDSAMHIYDEGVNYDQRFCDCTLQLSPGDATSFNNFFRVTGTSYGRGQPLILYLPINSGFFPFGPDIGDGWNLTSGLNITLEITSPAVQKEEPWRYFEIGIRIRSVATTSSGTFSYPAYSLPTEEAEGEFVIGSITDNRYPVGGFDNSGNQYADHKTFSENSYPYCVDNGTGGDTYNAVIPMLSNESKAAAIINHLTQTVRGNTFNIQGSANGYYYIFGRDKSAAGNFVARLTTDTIEITHENNDRFSYQFPVRYISGL